MLKMHQLPNLLTFLRLLLVPIIIFLIYTNEYYLLVISSVLFVLAILLDIFDGYIARKYNAITKSGTVFDPIVDKILMLSVLFVFTEMHAFPMWICLLLLAREFFVTGIRQLASDSGKILGNNRMGKFKFVFQIAIVLVNFYFLIERKDALFGMSQNVWFNTLGVVNIFIAYVFAIIFMKKNIHFMKINDKSHS